MHLFFFFENPNCSSSPCLCVKQYLWCVLREECVKAPSPLCSTSWGRTLSWPLCADWRFQAGPWSLPPVTLSMTFTGVQGRAVHLQEKTNKHGGRGSASVQALLIWLSVSMEPQPQILLACVTAWFSHGSVCWNMRPCMKSVYRDGGCSGFVIGKCLPGLFWTFFEFFLNL